MRKIGDFGFYIVIFDHVENDHAFIHDQSNQKSVIVCNDELKIPKIQ